MTAKQDTRYGHRSGSGSNEPNRHETVTDPPASDPAGDMSQGKRTRGAEVTANRPHLEGAEQGPR
jgi:hypothetical protein